MAIKVSNLKLAFQTGSANTLFATWTFPYNATYKNQLDSYAVQWYYDTGNGRWFDGGGSSGIKITTATYTPPSNAINVKVSVRPISKKYKKNNKEVYYWTGTSTQASYAISRNPPGQMSAPTCTLNGFKLTTKLENIEDSLADRVEFEIYRDNTRIKVYTVIVSMNKAEFTMTITPGYTYKARCRAINMYGTSKIYGTWSQYSSGVTTIPTAISGLRCTVQSSTSVRLDWTAVSNAESYKVEYTTDKNYFDSSSNVSSVTTQTNYANITGLETGEEWYFRVCAVNDNGDSEWSNIVYKILGTKPEAPTTWSLTSTAVSGEDVILYWVHNSEDGSKQTQAQIELTYNASSKIITVNTDSGTDDEEDPIYSYNLDISSYPSGGEVLWRVRTRGITNEYSDWSVQRSINIYSPAVATVVLGNGSSILERFPYRIQVTAGPPGQEAITYNISIIAEESYETIDQTGKTVYVSAGTVVFSKVFNASSNELTYDLMPEDVTLENNQLYKVEVTVSMNSGLVATDSDVFSVVWEDIDYTPDASVTIDEETYIAYITPFCIDSEENLPGNIVLSVYRRDFDGNFVEIGSNIDNNGVATVIDPHPSLDYARYRIVARDFNTSACTYSDLPGVPVNGPYIVIQWDEEYTPFDFNGEGEGEYETQPYNGTMLVLPYNVDISENPDPDVSHVEYIGRNNPVSYYGTQKGVSQTWSTDIDKEDKDTIYMLRKLSVWAGDVYVRESSGNGFWASVKVNMDIKHDSLVASVKLDITRVEGDEP